MKGAPLRIERHPNQTTLDDGGGGEAGGLAKWAAAVAKVRFPSSCRASCHARARSTTWSSSDRMTRQERTCRASDDTLQRTWDPRCTCEFGLPRASNCEHMGGLPMKPTVAVFVIVALTGAGCA